MSNGTDSSNLPSQLAEFASKVLKPGGVGVGSAYGLWALLWEEDAGKAIAAVLIGFCFSYLGKLLEPLYKTTQQQVGAVGEVGAKVYTDSIEQLLARVTKAEDAYLIYQSLDCRDYRTLGLGDRGYKIPELPEVFVPLELDSNSIPAGFEKQRDIKSLEEWQKQLNIWYFLRTAQQERAYRQLAIVAWGGYGKTTLLKYLAYIYGTKQHEQFNVPFLVPMLLPLRLYRQVLSEPNPPGLAELVMQHHIKQLAELDTESKLARLPSNWAENVLRDGKALVMLDGFDEVPDTERPGLSEWIHRQMQRFEPSTFILTSRPTAYKEDYAQPLRTKLWVRPLERGQQEKFVHQWYFCQERLNRGGRDTPEVRREAKRNAKNLLDQIHDPARPELAKLAKNPLLLNLLATYHRNSEQGAELPRQRAELYQDICVLSLQKRPQARDIPMPLTVADRLAILQVVALKMMQAKRRLVPEAALLKFIDQILQKQRHPVSAEDFLKSIVDVSELIVRQGLEGCEFAHLSFQEYLAAAQIKALKQEELLYAHLQDSNHAGEGDKQPWWRQTILLYAAQVDPTTLIEEAIRQDATDLAYACWQETRRTLAPEIEAKLQPQVQQSRYTKLEELMKAGKWREADQETYRLMITAVGKDEGQWFDAKDLLEFPCEDLRAINQLWVKYSNGKFGFSVQKKIYVECGAELNGEYPGDEIWDEFCDRIGWKRAGEYVEYSDLKFSPASSSTGELPLIWAAFKYFGLTKVSLQASGLYSFLARRLVDCST